MNTPIANHKTKDYDDDELCKDFARSDLSIAEIASKHGLSVRYTYELAKGESRPDIKARVNGLIEAEHEAAKRLARSRGRWFMARLIQLAQGTKTVKPATATEPEVVELIHTDTALKAVMKGLEIAGLADAEEYREAKKQAIEIILSTADGNGDPLTHRRTGVYRPTTGGNN